MLLRRGRRSSVLAFACATLLLTSLAAQQPKVLAPHRPVPPLLPPSGKPHKAPELRSMVGGFWMTDANMKSTIYLKNIEKLYAITASPTLYLSNGKALTLPDVKLDPSGTVAINVNDTLRDLGIAPWSTLFGYVEVQYTFPWDPLCVTVQSVDAIHSVIFTSGLRSQIRDSGSPVTRVVEGMWWKQESNVTGFVAVSNTTPQPLSATIDVTDSEDINVAHHAVVVSPRGTKLVELKKLAYAVGPGGIRVRYNGPEGGILVNGELEDVSKGYSATIPFLPAPPPAGQPSSVSFAEMGLMTGAADPMMKFPPGTSFTPYSLIRNVSDQPVPVNLDLYWMEAGSARNSRLQRLTLPPHRTLDLGASSLAAMAGLRNFNGSFSLIVDVKGDPDSVLMTAGSVDQSFTYVFESFPSAAMESAGKSISRWTTANGDDTMVTLWNPADEAQDLVFTVYFSGGQYKYPIHLEPRATRMFNVSEIVQNQFPDAEGNLIPVVAHEGSAEITGPFGPAQHILVAVEASTYNVQKATCGWLCLNCYGVIDTWITASPFAVAVGGSTQLSFIEEWSGGLGDLNSTKDTGVSWSSNHTNIATVSEGLTRGISAGSVQTAVTAPQEPIPGQNCGAPPPACHQPMQPVNPPPAPGCVDPIPASETTTYAGLTYTTEGSFIMTLNPSSTCNYNGHNVQETNYATGTDTCFWPGANITNPPSVAGSTWLVGSGTGISTNQYGIDSIGFPSTGVNYIQQNAEEHDIDFPCVVTFYQQMSFETDANTYQGYAENVDTQTIGGNTVTVCRAGVCTGTIPF
jgi:hypothetical protein